MEKNAGRCQRKTHRLYWAGGICSKEVGHPSRRILAVCEDKQCDAIVIGCRGLSGIEEFFLGSVSGKVLEYSKVLCWL